MKELISFFGYLVWLILRAVTMFILTAIPIAILGAILYRNGLIFLSQLLAIPAILSLFLYLAYFKKQDYKKGMNWRLFEYSDEPKKKKNNVIKF